MQAYWWDGVPNFGDRLTPLLLKKFAGLDVTWSHLAYADIVVTGSVLHHIPINWGGIVAGAGLLRRDLLPREGASYIARAVRGPHTARLLGARNAALGDPGLLADELLPQSPSKKWDLGIVPHWSDNLLATDPQWYNERWSTVQIDTRLEPMEVTRLIGECRKIVTSSLHGLIVADAFGIPRRFEPCELFNTDTLFKFDDYHASIGMTLEPHKVQTPHYGRVLDRKHELYDVLESLTCYG